MVFGYEGDDVFTQCLKLGSNIVIPKIGHKIEQTLNYFKIKQRKSMLFDGFAQISTDVPKGEPCKLIEEIELEDFYIIFGIMNKQKKEECSKEVLLKERKMFYRKEKTVWRDQFVYSILKKMIKQALALCGRKKAARKRIYDGMY